MTTTPMCKNRHWALSEIWYVSCFKAAYSARQGAVRWRRAERSEQLSDTVGLRTALGQVYGSISDVDNTVRWCGGRDAFYSLLRSKMVAPHARCREQVLYILCNVTASATTNAEHKDFIVSQPELLQHIVANLEHVDPRVKVASLWCTINLAWAESAGAAQRQHVLINYGLLPTLQKLLVGADLDVKDRSKTTLEQFYSCGNVPPSWNLP